ncbi:hypothetical protein D9M68_704250 [compost metagenome]
MAWASATLFAYQPMVSSDSQVSFMPSRNTRPTLGLNPTTPQYAAGRIIEPPVCVPRAAGTMPAATAAAEPLEEPPGVCASAWGLRVGPGVLKANSAVTVLPTGIAPAARNMPTLQASNAALPAVKAGAPKPVGISATSITSLMPMGTPASAPAAWRSGSIRSSAATGSTWLQARIAGSWRAMAARLWRAAANAAASPSLTPWAMAVTEAERETRDMCGSGVPAE